mgnify:CR=1 FL=1
MEKDLVRRLLERMGSEALQRLRTNINKDNTRASGALHDSMYYKIVKTRIDIYMANYAKAIDEGTNPRAGKPSSYFVGKIKKWMQSKGLTGKVRNKSGKVDINKSARAIAESIYEKDISYICTIFTRLSSTSFMWDLQASRCKKIPSTT